MKEFMLLIRNDSDSKSAFSPEQHHEFVSQCGVYINQLIKEGKMISAQPLVREGVLLSGSNGKLEESPYNEGKEVIVGYYHILANDIDDAIEIAKGNPEFTYSTTARVEVRPVKTKEVSTGFEYPKHA